MKQISEKIIIKDNKCVQKKITTPKRNKKNKIHATQMALVLHNSDSLDKSAIEFRLCGENMEPEMYITLEGMDILDITQNLIEYIKPHLKHSEDINTLYS